MTTSGQTDAPTIALPVSSLLVWILTGFALDIAALWGTNGLLAFERLSFLLPAETAFVVSFVHFILLRHVISVARLPGARAGLRLAARSVLLAGVAAVAPLSFGFCIGYPVTYGWTLVARFLPGLSRPEGGMADLSATFGGIPNLSVMLVAFVGAGAATAFVINALDEVGGEFVNRASEPRRRRVDILGGAIAGGLMSAEFPPFLPNHWSQPTDGLMVRDAVVLVAIFPHLLMSGYSWTKSRGPMASARSATARTAVALIALVLIGALLRAG